MTAEERMAYFQGEKRRQSIYQERSSGKNWDVIFLKIKFFIAIALFIFFLSLDYTGYKIKGIGSKEIVDEITKDFDFNEFEKFAL